MFWVLQDAHNCILEFDEETSMFAVYDGHGGNTVNSKDMVIFRFAGCTAVHK